MSAAPHFRAVLFVDGDQAFFFSQTQKKWKMWDDPISLNSAVPAEILEQYSGEPLLVLVSDANNGHLQFTLDNKRKNLTQEHIDQVLAEDYDIDTSAYELSWKQFPLNRETVQISVSGIEHEIFDKVEKWAAELAPKKLWLMPFAWFVSVLKSIDPAFAAIEHEGKLHVSHHYLGIDDARVLSVEDMPKYIAARQQERKETHLLYFQTSKELQEKLEKLIGKEEVTLQPFVEKSKDDPLTAVISEAFVRGEEAIGELLHFERTFAGQPVVAASAAGSVITAEEIASKVSQAEAEESADDVVEEVVPSTNSDLDDDSQTAVSGDLTPPVPPILKPPTPPAGMGAHATRVKVEPETEADVVAETVEAAAVVESEPEEKPVSHFNKAKPEVEPEPESTVEEVAAIETVPAEIAMDSAEPEPDALQENFVTQLKGNGVKNSNANRYTPIEAKRSWKGPILVFIFVVLLTAVVGGAVFWSQQGGQLLGLVSEPTPEASPIVSPMPSPTPTETPAPTPDPGAAAVKKDTLKVLLLNGTGVNGLAGKIKTQLQTAGWKNVTTANATGTYKDSDFVSSSADAAVVSALSSDLNRTLKPGDITEAKGKPYDVVVVIAVP